MIVGMFIFLLLIFAIMIFGYMENTVSGRGIFEGFYEYKLKSSVQSKVFKVSKKEGDFVKKGEILLMLDDRNQQEKMELLHNEIEELKSEISVAAAELEIKKHDPLPKEYRHTLIELNTAKMKCQKSLLEEKIFKKLYDKKVISLMKYQQKQLAHLSNVSEYKTRLKDYNILKNGLAKKIITKAESELHLLKTRLKSKESEYKLLFSHLEDYVMRSPENGIIRYIPPKPGAYVEPGDILIRVATTDKKKFTVYVDEKRIYRIQEGQHTRICSSQYNYLEYGYFEGKVMQIGGMTQSKEGQNYYPVKILLTKEPEKLRLGSTGQAYIETGKDRIIFCLSGWKK